MRQAGIIAAAGIVALETMRERLSDDHAHAKLIASRIGKLPGVSVKTENLAINMVFFALEHPSVSCSDLAGRLAECGIRVGEPAGNVFRFVTHREVTAQDAEAVCRAFEEILG